MENDERKKEHHPSHEKEHGSGEHAKKKCCDNISTLAAVGLAVAFLVAGILIGAVAFPKAQPSSTSANQISNSFVALPKDSVATKTIAYINENLLNGKNLEAKLLSVESYGNAMYTVNVDLFDTSKNSKVQSTSVFVTQDANLMIFQQPLNMNEKLPAEPAAQTAQAETLACNDVKKAESAKLEAFIVSKCPFGLQAQRMLAPIAAAGFSANIKVRYLGEIVDGKISSMHDSAPNGNEALENLRQICLREEQSDKYWPYVSEFIKKGDSNAALSVAKVDVAKLNSCMNDSAKGLKYAQEDFSLSAKYRASASPTIIVNGTDTSEFAFAAGQGLSQGQARSAENVKNLICCGFNTAPGTCSTLLSTDGANTSFSESYSSGTTTGAASCGV